MRDIKKHIAGLGKNDPLTNDGSCTQTSYRFDLLPPESLLAAAQVMHEGHEKGYKPGGWRALSTRDHLNHAMGHMTAHLMGYNEGGEGEDHLSHAMVRLMFAWATYNGGMET